nr:FecR family protein [uncultured Draconibacterium sp.]
MNKNRNMPDFNYKRTREKIISEIQKHEPGFTMGKPKKRSFVTRFKQVYKIAAIALVLLAVGGVVVVYQSTDNTTDPIVQVYREFNTTPGENLKVDLPDGSSILLNGGSSLRFIEQFSATKREVQIKGEAYCKIAKEKARPFIVNLGEYKVQVLGTTFNVDAYPENENISVALVEGSVKVEAKQGDDVSLKPGKMVVFNQKTNQYVKCDFDFNEQLGWRNKNFRFKNTPLPEVYKQLEYRYGVHFKTGNLDVSDVKINASFDNTPFLTMITAIELGTELSYKILENKDIIVKKK